MPGGRGCAGECSRGRSQRLRAHERTTPVGCLTTPMNRYQCSRVLGLVLAVLGACVVALSYPPPSWLAAEAVLLIAAGVLMILSGTPSALRDRVGPHRLLGAGNAVLGAWLVVLKLGDTGTDAELAYAIAVGLGGASLAFVGLAYVFRPGDFGLGSDGFPE
ncbi:hypothetical protein VNG_0347H [Halobacterium salinarum NRC-1]|uniref:Uncharacterized protein n=5 Tax=Halobacterium salinarum TaxID=2242 RepID=Q9HS91_HALSA|nr:hypothetical protein VNG_0347H [Halobacterium salinarum NRC-1]